ncbi:hypothetical protein B0H14DRAFT_2615042 [Mycena olivaceomarginata]|nr:hypothetical protein B0H14DRAFT_2615042 [Mycena olivaceomarginata]
MADLDVLPPLLINCGKAQASKEGAAPVVRWNGICTQCITSPQPSDAKIANAPHAAPTQPRTASCQVPDAARRTRAGHTAQPSNRISDSNPATRPSEPSPSPPLPLELEFQRRYGHPQEDLQEAPVPAVFLRLIGALVRPRTTRSSKARLLSDPMENTALLTEQLRSLGLYAAPTIGDGNCLFRALSDQLYGSPSRHPPAPPRGREGHRGPFAVYARECARARTPGVRRTRSCPSQGVTAPPTRYTRRSLTGSVIVGFSRFFPSTVISGPSWSRLAGAAGVRCLRAPFCSGCPGCTLHLVAGDDGLLCAARRTWYIDIDAADGIRPPRRSLSATWLAGTTPTCAHGNSTAACLVSALYAHAVDVDGLMRGCRPGDAGSTLRARGSDFLYAACSFTWGIVC